MSQKGKLLGILKKILPDDINAEISVLTRTTVETKVSDNSLVGSSKRQERTVHIRVEHEGRVGRHIGTGLTVSSLREALARARANAANGPPGPLILTGSTGYREMDLFQTSTAQQSAAAQAESLRPLLELSGSMSVRTDAVLTAQAGEFTVVNTKGLAASTAATLARFQVLVRGEGAGQGYGYACDRDAHALDVMSPFLTAAAKSLASSYPKPISGGKYTVIFEPAAVADLVALLARTVFNGRAYLEGRSPLAQIGQKIFGENINIWDDGLDPHGLAIPFDFQGVSKQRLNLVSRGVVPNIALDNGTAAALGLASSGHAPEPGESEPRPTHIFMEPGNAMLDDMVASTRRGILVSRLGNLAILDPRTCLVTGVTGNGTLLIEEGKLTSALHNLRFVQNLVQVFNQVEMIGDETHLFGGLWGGTRAPALKVQDFGILGSNIGQG